MEAAVLPIVGFHGGHDRAAISDRHQHAHLKEAGSGRNGLLHLFSRCTGSSLRPKVSAEAWYRANGVLPESEGGGPRGTLVTSEDSPLGGIDSRGLEQLMKRIFKLYPTDPEGRP